MKLRKPTRPFPVADRSRDGELYEHMHPRLAAIRLLREKLADRHAGLDPYDGTIFLLQVHPDERVWANRAVELTGLVLDVRRHGDGVRFRAVLEADVRHELGLDRPDAPILDEGPVASRGLRVLTLQEGRLADEGPAMRALHDAHAAYDRRYPDGAGLEVR